MLFKGGLCDAFDEIRQILALQGCSARYVHVIFKIMQHLPLDEIYLKS